MEDTLREMSGKKKTMVRDVQRDAKDSNNDGNAFDPAGLLLARGREAHAKDNRHGGGNAQNDLLGVSASAANVVRVR